MVEKLFVAASIIMMGYKKKDESNLFVCKYQSG